MATLQLAISTREILADAKAVERGLSGIQQSASRTFHGVKSAADIALGPLKAMIKLTVAMKASMIALGAASVGAAGQYEMFNQQLRTVIRTKSEADRAFKESIEFSVRTPFTPEQVIRTRLELEAVGVRGGEALERVAMAAAAMNRDIGDVGRAVKSMELEPLRGLGIMMDDLYARGVSREFRQSTEEFRKAQSELLEMFSERYGGGLGRMSITWQGLVSTLKGAVFDLRAAFGEGFLDESKLIVDDLIEASKGLKEYARGAGKEFGDEMMVARAYVVAGFDTALKVAEQIKVAMSQGETGEVILQAFKLGAKVVGRGIITAFEVSLPLWKTIGTIVGQGVLSALYGSNFPGAELARGLAIRKNLESMGVTDLRKLAARENFDVGFTTREGATGARDYGTRPYTRPKTAGELAGDITNEIQKLSVEQQLAYAQVDPGQAIYDSIEKSRQAISKSMDELGTQMVADLQGFVNQIAAASGQEPVNITEEFKQSLQQRLGEGENIIEEWRKKLEMQDAATGETMVENAEAVTDAVGKSESDRARALAQMYSTIEVYDQRAYEVKLSLLKQELEEFRALKIEETDIERYQLEQQRRLRLEYAQQGDDFTEGFEATMEQLKEERLTLGEVGAGTAKSIHGEWVSAFQGMATEGAKWSDAMEGFFSNVGTAFTNLMAQMAAEAILFDAIMPLGQALGSAFAGGGSGGGSGGGFTPGSYEGITTYHTGGVVGSGGASRLVDPSMFAFAPRLHRGLRPNEFPAILEQGERVTAKGQSADGVEVHMHYEGLPLQMAKQASSMQGDKRVVDIWLKAAENDPRVKRRLSNR